MERMNITDAEIEAVIAGIKEKLQDNRMNSFSYNHKPQSIKLERNIVVNFTAQAWYKMNVLVDKCSTEIAWHGLVKASEDRKYFSIYDILMYPQTLSSATVVTDETKYEPWHQALNDEQYNDLRMQGHSHVNMAASPSGRDNETYDAMLQTLSGDSYYIFLIMNKRNDLYFRIYDIPNNVIYDKSDIDITIDDMDFNAWYKENLALYSLPSTPVVVTPATPFNYAAPYEQKKTLATSKTSKTLIVTKYTAADLEIFEEKIMDPGPEDAQDEFLGYDRDRFYGLMALMEKMDEGYALQFKKPAGHKPEPKISCLGCKNLKKYNPKKAPCKNCEVLKPY